MRFQDEAIVLSLAPMQEEAILTVLTKDHGLHKGVLRPSPKTRSFLEPGSHLSVRWTARLAEHLGSWSVEPIKTPVADILDQPLALQALNSACHLLYEFLPEREPQPLLFERLLNLTQAFSDDLWLAQYCLFECDFVRATGMPLDFSKCAVTGDRSELVYVSPKSGKAVSRFAGADYKDKLLPLPSFLRLPHLTIPPQMDEIRSALKLSGFFIEHYVLQPHGRSMPAARTQFFQMIELSEAASTRHLNQPRKVAT